MCDIAHILLFKGDLASNKQDQGGWSGQDSKRSDPYPYSYLIEFIRSVSYSGIPEFRPFGQKGKFSAFGFRFRPPKLKAEYGRNSRKALDFFFPSVFQDGLVFLIHFWQLIFASTLTLK